MLVPCDLAHQLGRFACRATVLLSHRHKGHQVRHQRCLQQSTLNPLRFQRWGPLRLWGRAKSHMYL